LIPWSVTPAPVWFDNLVRCPESYPRAGNFAAVRDNHAMNAEIEKHLPEIERLCRKYGVSRLELFGSATGSDFNPATSDFDFVATFADTSFGSDYGWRFLGFARALENLLGRSTDVITPDSIQRPQFRAAVDSSRRVVYETESGRAIA
jgi:predicted nucleotidyltransferase